MFNWENHVQLIKTIALDLKIRAISKSNNQVPLLFLINKFNSKEIKVTLIFTHCVHSGYSKDLHFYLNLIVIQKYFILAGYGGTHL